MITSEWNEVNSTGSIPNGIFGHTTTLIGNTTVILFGGVIASEGSMTMINSVYNCNILKNQWTLLKRSISL